ncbi:TerD family protein [Prevotellamassilia timonensis]|jgi:tellurium resistance protein TerD|uniref:TerD family protein n=1 Tax=Prevotellamassilia timonensis TaxID=1852370 RepID=UPI003078EB98
MINLIKGQRVEIEAGLTRLRVEMGWKVNPNAKPPYDLDASTFLLGSNGQIENEYDFVFYGSPNKVQVLDEEGNPVMRPVSVDKSVLGSVDDLGDDDDNTGEGNEEIDVDLTKTSSRVNEILFTASIYWSPSDANDPELAPRMHYNFGQVRDAYIQIKNAVNGEVICRYDLDEDFSTDKGVEFGRLYRRGSEWKFQAVGEAHKDGLEPICRKYASKFM